MPVKYLCLENVDRLLRTPKDNKGNDFAVILASLSDLGYAVEWRVINAAEYGFPQRRKRVFILAYHQSTGIYRNLVDKADDNIWLTGDGILAKAFPVLVPLSKARAFAINIDIPNVVLNSNVTRGRSPFENSGFMIDRKVITQKLFPRFDGPLMVMADVLCAEKEVDESFYIDLPAIPKWQSLKKGKSVIRTSKTTGRDYRYSEGAMPFPDALDKPSRTVITSEGSKSVSRTTHVIAGNNDSLRRLMPVELERLFMFPDDHTAGVTNVQRGFLLGNALVAGVVEEIGRELAIEHFKTQNEKRAIYPIAVEKEK